MARQCADINSKTTKASALIFIFWKCMFIGFSSITKNYYSSLIGCAFCLSFSILLPVGYTRHRSKNSSGLLRSYTFFNKMLMRIKSITFRSKIAEKLIQLMKKVIAVFPFNNSRQFILAKVSELPGMNIEN